MMGKHSQEALKIKQLEETIELSVKKRKISELCTDTRYELLIDELEVCYKKQKTKIIELPNTDQSNK